MLDWILGLIVVAILFFAYRYVKKHGKCTGCSGCKPNAHAQTTQSSACSHDCSRCKHCVNHDNS